MAVHNKNSNDSVSKVRPKGAFFLSITFFVLLLNQTRKSHVSIQGIRKKINIHTYPAPSFNARCNGIYLDESMALLTSALKNESDYIGLRQIGFTNIRSKTPIYFRGLDAYLLKTTLVGERLAFIGDSTLKNLFWWLDNMLNLTINSHPFPTFMSRMNLADANDNYTSLFEDAITDSSAVRKNVKKHKVSYHGNNTAVMYNHVTESFDDNVLSNLSDFKPTIVVANIGLHMLHFQNLGRDGESRIGPWLDYEHALHNITLVAEASGAKLLLFKTTNSICSEKYTDEFARASTLYSVDDYSTLSNCQDILLQNLTSSRIVGTPPLVESLSKDVANYCKNGAFIERGSQHLNRRLFQFVENARKIYTSDSFQIAVFNDHDIQSCNYTAVQDGRHYQPLNLVRIRLLANMINCLVV